MQSLKLQILKTTDYQTSFALTIQNQSHVLHVLSEMFSPFQGCSLQLRMCQIEQILRKHNSQLRLFGLGENRLIIVSILLNAFPSSKRAATIAELQSTMHLNVLFR